jgi:hypothetical protein
MAPPYLAALSFGARVSTERAAIEGEKHKDVCEGNNFKKS